MRRPRVLRALALRFAVPAALGLTAACGTPASPPPPRVFLSLPAADAVQVLQAETGEQLAQTSVGMLPHMLLPSVDGRRVYVSVTGSQSVAELEAASGALLRTFLPAPGPTTRADGSDIVEHARDDAAAHPTCFACHGTGAARPAVVGSRPYGLALSADGETLFVSNQRNATVSRVRLATGTLETPLLIASSGEAHEPTALGRMGAALYLTVLPTLPSLAPSVLRAMDENGAALGEDTLLGANAGSLLTDASRDAVFVSNFETNTVTEVSGAGAIKARHVVGNGPFGSLVDGDALLVANFYDNSVSRVMLGAGDVVTRPLGKTGTPRVNPTHLQRAGDALFVLSSGTEGYLLTLDPVSLETRSEVRVSGLPFDLLVVP